MQDDTPFAMTLMMAVCALLGWPGQRMSVARLPSQLRQLGGGEKSQE
ncbi:TPA: hypothetical protein N2E80_002469 [Salmonella enterica]|nr:hypothetical protein [Salmonella enterica]